MRRGGHPADDKPACRDVAILRGKRGKSSTDAVSSTPAVVQARTSPPQSIDAQGALGRFPLLQLTRRL
jgi:hypothetical protein